MSSVDTILEEARSHLKRLEPHELHALKDALVVDIRPIHNRLAEGEIENSVVVERIVLEWRLDPAGDWRLPGFTADTTVVVVCNEGWASSLAARDLQLDRAAGLPAGREDRVQPGHRELRGEFQRNQQSQQDDDGNTPQPGERRAHQDLSGVLQTAGFRQGQASRRVYPGFIPADRPAGTSPAARFAVW